MLKDGFLRFCDDPEIACCRGEAELGQLRQENIRLRAELLESQRRERAAVTAVGRMAEYIVTLGRVDYFLCDNIPKDLHLKHQPKNDGNYDNAPCIKCVAEYFMSGPQAGEVEP